MIQHACRDKLADMRREVFPRQPHVTEVDCERNERAAGMIEGDKRGIGYDVKRLFPAVVRMRAPADVA